MFNYKSKSVEILVFLLYLSMTSIGTLCHGHVSNYTEKRDTQKKEIASLTIANSKIDLGTLIQGEIAEFRTVLHNTGSQTVNITGIVSRTEGLNAVLSDMTLEPGAEGILEGTLDTTFLYGQLVGQISIVTDIEENPTVTLSVKANIEPILVFTPPSIFCGQIAKDASYSGKTMLIGKLVNENKLKNLTIKTSSPAIEVKVHDEPVPTGGLLVEFILHPELKAGTFKEKILVVSKDPPAQTQLYLMGQKLGIIRVTPDRFEFFGTDGKKQKEKTILFECEKSFKIIKIEDLSEGLDLSLKVLKKGKKYRLTAKLKNIPEGGILSVLKVYTDLKEHPLIHIPVIAGRRE